jgi:hypothetical protein
MLKVYVKWNYLTKVSYVECKWSRLIEEFNMVSFIGLNIHDEDCKLSVLSHADNAIQYGEEILSPKSRRGNKDNGGRWDGGGFEQEGANGDF